MFHHCMMCYHFTITHVPGKGLIVADMFSKSPTSTPTSADQLFHQEGNIFISTVIQNLQVIKASANVKNELDNLCGGLDYQNS